MGALRTGGSPELEGTHEEEERSWFGEKHKKKQLKKENVVNNINSQISPSVVNILFLLCFCFLNFHIIWWLWYDSLLNRSFLYICRQSIRTVISRSEGRGEPCWFQLIVTTPLVLKTPATAISIHSLFISSWVQITFKGLRSINTKGQDNTGQNNKTSQKNFIPISISLSKKITLQVPNRRQKQNNLIDKNINLHRPINHLLKNVSGRRRQKHKFRDFGLGSGVGWRRRGNYQQTVHTCEIFRNESKTLKARRNNEQNIIIKHNNNQICAAAGQVKATFKEEIKSFPYQQYTCHPSCQQTERAKKIYKTINAEKRNARKCTYIRVFTSSGLLHPNPNMANWGIGGSSRARAPLKCTTSEWNCIKLQHMFIFPYFVNVFHFHSSLAPSLDLLVDLTSSTKSPPSPTQHNTITFAVISLHCNQSSF